MDAVDQDDRTVGPLPAGLVSVAAAWADAWRLPMYEIAPATFDQQVLERLAAPGTLPRQFHGACVSIASVALKLALQGGQPERVARIASRAQALADPVATRLRGGPPEVAATASEARLLLALAGTLAAPALPPDDLLRELVQDFLGLFGSGRKPDVAHPALARQLLLAAHLALLAQDAELLARVAWAAPRKGAAASRHWPLYRGVAQAAATRPGRHAVCDAIREAGQAARFMALLNLHRRPLVADELGPEGTLCVPPVVANYLYCWTYARLLRPEPADGMDWPTMRRLMTG